MLVVARIVLMTLLNQLAWFPPSGAPPPYAESWLEACLSVTPATRREGSAPANAESRSGHGIMVPGRACSALQFSDFCCPGRQTGCLRALGHPIFRGLGLIYYMNSIWVAPLIYYLSMGHRKMWPGVCSRTDGKSQWLMKSALW